MKLSFRLNKTTAFVFDYLTDMQKFTSVHPVITKIDDYKNDHYLVHETLRIGFIPFSFTYPVLIDKDPINKVVTIRATVMKVTKIEMVFRLKQENGSTVIEEDIQFKSPLPVASIMKSIFKKQHSQLFQNMEMVIERV